MIKVLRKIFGPLRVGDDFRIRFDSELYELLNDVDVVQRINIQRLRWLGHAVRMEENAHDNSLAHYPLDYLTHNLFYI